MPAPLAGRASPRSGNGQSPLSTIDRLIERQLDAGVKVFAPRRAALLLHLVTGEEVCTLAAPGAVEEVAKQIPEIDSSGSFSTEMRAPPSGLCGVAIGPQRFGFLLVETDLGRVLAKLIVQFPLLRIGEHFEGARDLFELLLGALVPRVDVRMIFAGKLAICLLD